MAILKDGPWVLFRHIIIYDNATDGEECSTHVFFPLAGRAFTNHPQDEP